MTRVCTHSIFVLAALWMLCFGTQALAVVRQTVSFTAVDSNGPLNSVSNSVRTAVVTGGYPLGRMTFSGSLTSLHVLTQLIDSRVEITAPNGARMTFQPFASGGTFATQSFNVPLFMSGVVDPAGTWTFRFYELIDNGGTAQIDARWNLSIAYSDDPPTAPSSTSFGTITAAGTTRTLSLSASTVTWARFSIGCSSFVPLNTYLDLDSQGTTLTGTLSPNDLQIAIYNSSGVLVASDDDSGPGFTPQLSFGVGTRAPIEDGDVFAGQHGPLSSGLYYLAMGAYPMTIQPASWGATANSTATGSITLHIRTNISTGIVPTILQQPTNATSRIGGTIVFSVSLFAGSAPISYQWRQRGVPIQNNARFSGVNTNQLTIYPVGATDSATYDVVISNPCSMTTSASVALTVACAADMDDGSGLGVPDGGVTIDDLLYYLRTFEAGDLGGDIDDGSGQGTPDGGVTIDDLLYYLLRFEVGC